MSATHKTAKVIKPYAIKAYHWDVVVPVGATVSNQTACGCDDSYRFWQDYGKYAKDLTGYENSILAHDLRFYGLNIPAEYCEPWPGTKPIEPPPGNPMECDMR